MPTTCLNARHFDRWKAGAVADQVRLSALGAQIRAYQLRGSHVSMGRWHMLGGLGELGVWLGFSRADREAMFLQVARRMDLCLRDRARYQAIKANQSLH